jgi:TPR repeat protein
VFIGGKERRLNEAAQVTQARAGEGDPKAQYGLGRLYYDGKGVPRDFTEAAYWCRKAADQGYAAAESYLGFMYGEGAGVAQDNAEAVRWYRKAADQGDTDAEYNLGNMYRQGKGVSRDYAEAVRWYSNAARQDDPSGEYGLGFMYYDGLGVPQNRAEAENEFRRAAEHGLPRAQYNLASMYYRGEGVPRDDAEAYRWFRKAAQEGDERSRSVLGLGSSSSWAGSKVASGIVLFGCLLFLISSLFPIPANIRAKTFRRDRARVLAGMVGLSYAGLSLYVGSGYGIAELDEVANAITLAEGFLFGAFLALMVSIFSPKITKILLVSSGVSFLALNYFAIAHYDLKDSFSAMHSYCLANGTFVGTMVTIVAITWWSARASNPT